MERRITLENRIEAVASVTTFVKEFCEDWGVNSDLMFNLTLALEEVTTNVIMYAFPTEEVHTFDVIALRKDDELILVVEDSGLPFDPTQVPEADISLPAEERPIGGLGIFLVRKIMDSVEYKREGDKNVLTLRKYI